VDDHRLMRQVLGFVVESEPDLSVVGAARDAESAFTAVAETSPDIVLMDLTLPGMDGIAATRTLVSRHPLVRVVMLSASCTRVLVFDALGAGAWGYFVKDGPLEELLHGIREVSEGRRCLAASAQALLDS
jgi:DNA-binding NarL/FixJ family response regulator